MDLAEVARRCADDPVLRHAGIDVEVRAGDGPARVLADPRRIDRIVRNLLANAAKYSHSPSVLVSVTQDDDVASLSVRDFGVGLDAEESLRVFDRFWRADPARVQGGTGLGLPIAREDALLHGGSLAASGTPGEGAEFVLTIPKRIDASLIAEPSR